MLIENAFLKIIIIIISFYVFYLLKAVVLHICNRPHIAEAAYTLHTTTYNQSKQRSYFKQPGKFVVC